MKFANISPIIYKYIYHIHDILTICSDTCMYALCRFTQSQTLLDNKQTLISPRKSGASETPKRAGNYLPRIPPTRTRNMQFLAHLHLSFGLHL